MNLKDFLARKDKQKELFWALVIEPGLAQAGIWEIEEGKAKVVSISPPAPWEIDSELVGACDTALSASIQNLAEGEAEPTKTVFGVPPSWVSGGQIKEENLGKIKNVCAELSLEPTGFVVLPEAIAHYFKSEEGSPLNAIVVGVGAQNLEIAVFRLGNLSGNTTVARSVSISEDISEGLSRFSGTEALPSRFILHDGKEGELEEVRQAIINTNWEEYEKIKFLHAPKVEVISSETKVIACALAGGAEIGNVSSVQLIKKEEEKKDLLNAEDVNFVVGKDILDTKGEAEVIQPAQQSFNPEPKAPTLPNVRLKNFLSFASGFKPQLPGSFSKILNGKTPVLIAGFLAALLGLGLAAWLYFPKATVTIFASPRTLEEKVELKIDTGRSSPDITAGLLPGEAVKTEVSGERTKATSGTKTVGDKAKGTVTIQNGTSTNILLPSGSLITSGGDLQFALIDSASISAALSPTLPGTSTVDVVASKIGAEYNLAKDETFKVTNYPKSEVDAVANSDFSGGTSREISAVAPIDLTNLEQELSDELLAKAKEKFKSDLPPDKIFVEESLTKSNTSRVFSNIVGDEAANIKLKLGIEVTGFQVPKKALYDMSREILKGKTPGGFVLRDSALNFTFKSTDKNNPEKYELTITANFLPDIKTEDIAKKIAGRDKRVAENYLTSIPSFVRAEIKFFPKLPGFLGTLPHNSKNISVEVSAER